MSRLTRPAPAGAAGACTQCAPPPPPVGQARADAATLAACREHADAVYDRNASRHDLLDQQPQLAVFGQLHAWATVDRGLPQRYGHENMTRDCVRNTGTETDRSDTHVAPPASRALNRRSRPQWPACQQSAASWRSATRASSTAGSVTCWTGSWMQRVATDWLAWELTHSALWVSVIAFCNLAPSVVISPLAGAVADRIDRVRLTVASQFVAAGPGGDPGDADPDRADPRRVHRRAVRVQRHGRDVRPAGAPMPAARPGSARLSARRGGAEFTDLQRRPLHRPGTVRPDDRRLGRGAADRLQLRGVPVRQPDHVPAAARSRRSGSATAPPTACSTTRSRASATSRATAGIGPLMLFAAAVGMMLRSVPEMLPPYVADLFGRDARGLATLASTMGLRRAGRRHAGGDPRPARRSDPHRGVRRPGADAGHRLLRRDASLRHRRGLHRRDGRGHHDAWHLDPDAAAELRLRPRWSDACSACGA